MTEIIANGSVADGRVKVDLELGFGTIVLNIEQKALLDDENVDLLERVLGNFGTHVENVFEAIAEKLEAQEEV